MNSNSSKRSVQMIITATIAIAVEIVAASLFYGWASAHNLLAQPTGALALVALASILFVVCQVAVVAILTKKLLSYISWIEEENVLYALSEFGESHSLKNQLRRVLGFAQLLHRRHNSKLNAEGREFLKYIYINAKVMSKGLQPKNDWAGDTRHSELLRKGYVAQIRLDVKALEQNNLAYVQKH